MTAIAATETPRQATLEDAFTGLIFAGLALVIALTFEDYGISWDEELHVPYGEKLLAYYTSGFADSSAFSYINLYQYGGFFDLLAALAQRVSPFGVYETRHLVGGVLFLAGLLGAWRLTRLLAGPRAGLIAVAALATTPVLYGHSFINPKDAPLAWLGVWVAYFACRALSEARATWLTVAGLGVSLGLALGTRIIAFAFIAQIGVVLAVKAFAQAGLARGGMADVGRLWTMARPFALALGLAFPVMALTWPWAVQAPFNIPSVFLTSANQSWHPWMLWAGELVNAKDLPAGYLATLLAVQLPEYVLVGAASASVLGIAALSGRGWKICEDAKALQYLYVVLSVAVPLVAFAALRPSTYNGVRHFLFLVPQLVILAAIGLDGLAGELLKRRRAWALAFAAVLVGGLLTQVMRMVRIHPYQYLSFNALAGGLTGAYGRFELDYWGVSYGEAARALVRVLDEEQRSAPSPAPVHRLFVCGANTSAAYYLPPAIAITDERAAADFFLGGDLTNPRCRVRPEGPAIVEVERGGAVLSYVLDLRKRQ